MKITKWRGKEGENLRDRERLMEERLKVTEEGMEKDSGVEEEEREGGMRD